MTAANAQDAERLARVAVALAARVGDRDPADNAAWLLARLPDPADWFRLVFVQAAANRPDGWHDAVKWARDGQVRPVDEETLPYEVWQILEHPRERTFPIAEVDEVAVRKFCNGQHDTPLNRAERVAVVAKLTEEGWTAADIAEALGVEPDSVQRVRARANQRKRAQSEAHPPTEEERAA
jgi:hypothetical protein